MGSVKLKAVINTESKIAICFLIKRKTPKAFICEHVTEIATTVPRFSYGEGAADPGKTKSVIGGMNSVELLLGRCLPQENFTSRGRLSDISGSCESSIKVC